MARTSSSAPTLAILLVAMAVGWYVVRDAPSPEAGMGEGSAGAEPAATPGLPGGSGGWEQPVLSAPEVCSDTGYLCHELQDAPAFPVLRFPSDHGVLTVGVPMPGDVDESTARELQRAAIRGIQVWDGHPFAIRIVQRDRGGATDLSFRWSRTLDGLRLGESLAQLQTGPGGAVYRSNGITLVTHSPHQADRIRSAGEIELTAAHEMGHALGLPHSDDPRDLMYPENTSTHPTSRDYRTLESLYLLPVGAEVRR